MFQDVVHYLESIDPVLAAFYATMFTWGVTALGASFVFFLNTTEYLIHLH